ncbi:MAG: PaeR7I family type II restriction endonuclease [Thermoplasmatota archaeon]
MDLLPADLEAHIRDAVRHYWRTRQGQATKQVEAGTVQDYGARSQVTGGKHMDGFVELIREVVHHVGLPEESVHTGSRLELPGFYRASKQWDLLVLHDGQLLAAIELKSQVGPSFGNNFNNRTEEAMGTAADTRAAIDHGAFGASSPWLGWLMLLEDAPKSRAPVKVFSPHFDPLPEFGQASYAKRYVLFCQKLRVQLLYDGTALLMSPATATDSGDWIDEEPEISITAFLKSLAVHLSATQGKAR